MKEFLLSRGFKYKEQKWVPLNVLYTLNGIRVYVEDVIGLYYIYSPNPSEEVKKCKSKMEAIVYITKLLEKHKSR